MEDPAFMKFMTSPMFTLVARGDSAEENEYHIHSDLLASLSTTLNELVNGSTKEAHERRVVWDTDERTIALFCEFAYTGDYEAVQRPPRPRRSIEQDGNIQGPYSRKRKAPSDEDLGVFGVPRVSFRMKSISFGKRAKNNAENASAQVDSEPPEQSRRFAEDAALAHARLMAFADYHGIPSLLRLSTQKLQEHIADQQVHFGVSLVKVLRSSTLPTRCVRDFLVEQSAKKIFTLWEMPRYRHAVQSRPDFMFEVLEAVIRRHRGVIGGCGGFR
ncbi:hypothetical protein NLU13_5222 [Sarocladium strictum]|uniref:BTB domain-containing protein n=1 Tax=Sarocladium strictum TaxID=5046 RepID=A0AA39GH79_SARSR|nr:hypothetical protein NLU13_5222 [Sarocladium strictum]